MLIVYSRDLNEDLSKHFHSIIGAFLAIINQVAHSGSVDIHKQAPNPELTGKLFECMSHLLK